MTIWCPLKAITGGLAVGAALVALVFVMVPWQEPGKEYSLWGVLFSNVGDALIATVPGCVAGFLFARRGFVIGATVGIVLTVATYCISAMSSWPAIVLRSEVTSSFLWAGVAASAAALITNGIAGVAGVYLRGHRRAVAV